MHGHAAASDPAVDHDPRLRHARQTVRQCLVAREPQVLPDLLVGDLGGGVPDRVHRRFLQQTFGPPFRVPEDPATGQVRVTLPVRVSGEFEGLGVAHDHVPGDVFDHARASVHGAVDPLGVRVLPAQEVLVVAARLDPRVGRQLPGALGEPVVQFLEAGYLRGAHVHAAQADPGEPQVVVGVMQTGDHAGTAQVDLPVGLETGDIVVDRHDAPVVDGERPGLGTGGVPRPEASVAEDGVNSHDRGPLGLLVRVPCGFVPRVPTAVVVGGRSRSARLRTAFSTGA